MPSMLVAPRGRGFRHEESPKLKPVGMSLAQIEVFLDNSGWKLKEFVRQWKELRLDCKNKDAEDLLQESILPLFPPSIDRNSPHDIQHLRRGLARYRKV